MGAACGRLSCWRRRASPSCSRPYPWPSGPRVNQDAGCYFAETVGLLPHFSIAVLSQASLTESRIGAVRRRQTVDLLAVAYDLDDSRHPPDGLKAVDPMLT